MAGELSSVSIADGRPRSVYYTNDLTGQVVRRNEQDNDYKKGDPSELWYRFNGRTLGYVGNNGTQDTSYQASIDSRTRTQGTGAFDGGSSYGIAYADFDQSVAPITSFAQGSGGGSYTVRGGDTLGGIAAQLWGDAGLWYKLAEANGLSSASALVAGQSLTIPSGVQKATHSAATFTPYDPAEAIGDTAPSVQPKAKKNKCGAFGAILLTVIAVAVTALTAVALPAAVSPVLTGALSATAGSVVSQAVGVATGIQDRFDWKGVAMAALSGAVGGALGNVGPFGSGTDFLTGFANGAVRGALGSLVTQTVGVATGLQKDFSWLGVATAGVGAGVAGGLGNVLKLESTVRDFSPANIARTALTNTASGIANATLRAVATGTSFGDNVLAALPDVLGQTVGGLVAGGLAKGWSIASSGATSVRPSTKPQTSGTISTGVNQSSLSQSGAEEGAAPRWSATGSATDAGFSEPDIVIVANRQTYDLFRSLSSYQIGRYLDRYDEVAFDEGARWASGLSAPTVSSPGLTAYSGPIARNFAEQGNPFQGFDWGGRSYANESAARADGMQVLSNGPSAEYLGARRRDAAFLNSIGSGLLGLGPIAYVNGRSADAINSSARLDMALGDLAVGVGIRGSDRVALPGPGRPVAGASPRPITEPVRSVVPKGEFADGLIYLRTDTTGKLAPYVGQTTEANELARQAAHARAYPNSRFEFETLESGIPKGSQLDIAEHNAIQALTGGVAARRSSAVSNQRDPVGPRRRPNFGLPEPR